MCWGYYKFVIAPCTCNMMAGLWMILQLQIKYNENSAYLYATKSSLFKKLNDAYLKAGVAV